MHPKDWHAQLLFQSFRSTRQMEACHPGGLYREFYAGVLVKLFIIVDVEILYEQVHAAAGFDLTTRSAPFANMN